MTECYYFCDFRENHLFDKIHLIHAKVEDAVLPVDSVDIIISEWMGYFLLYEGMLDSVITARNKYLSPGGRILPNRCALYVVGISDTGIIHLAIISSLKFDYFCISII